VRGRGALLAALATGLLVGATPAARAAPAQPPRRIMSMTLCNDLLLLMLVPRERITSITYLAHDAVKGLMPGADAGVATNRGTTEEIVLQRPDLILASPWTAPRVRRLSKAIGAPIVEVEDATDFASTRRIIRQIGAAVGEGARAEALVRGMDADLAALARRRPARPVRVALWSGDGSVPGRGTLTDAIITAAGGINIAARQQDRRSSSFGLEELLAARPDAVMQGVGNYGAPSLRRNVARHPLIDRLFAGRQIDYPDVSYTCGLPQSARAARELAAAFAALPRGGPRW